MTTRREVFEFIAAIARQDKHAHNSAISEASGVYLDEWRGEETHEKDLLRAIELIAEWAAYADWEKYR